MGTSTSRTVSTSSGDASKCGGLALDIDNTLSATNEHWVDHLVMRFGTPGFGLSQGALVSMLASQPCSQVWRSDEARSHIDFMKSDPDFQAVGIPVIDGAVQGVRDLHAVTPISCYMTVRPASSAVRTREWLLSHGFPDLPIYARPPHVAHEDGNAWKGKLLQDSHPSVTGIVDDSTSVLRACGDDYKGRFFLFGKNSSDVPRFAAACMSWLDVVGTATAAVEAGHLPSSASSFEWCYRRASK